MQIAVYPYEPCSVADARGMVNLIVQTGDLGDLPFHFRGDEGLVFPPVDDENVMHLT